jgi:hypothetical protein
MIRRAFTFSAVLSLVSMAGCNEIPVLACGSEEDSRRFQGELEGQSDPRKLWEAISSASKRCTTETTAQKKIVQDAIARWAKAVPPSDQRSAYAALPGEATDLRVALLNATDTLGLLSEMGGNVSESSPETVGVAGKKLSLSSADVARLTVRHKWLSDVLTASEVDGYRIYVTRSSKSYNSNPDRLLVEAPAGHEYTIQLMTELYDPKDKSPLFQVVRVGKEGQLALMVRQHMLGASGGSEALTFYQLKTGQVIPRIDSHDGSHSLTKHNPDASPAGGVSAYRLHFLKDADGSVLYAIRTRLHQPGDRGAGQACSATREYFAFRNGGFAAMDQLTAQKEVDCSTPAKAKSTAVFSAADDYMKLSHWGTGTVLTQLVDLDRRDASDEMLLQTLRSKAPSSLLALIETTKPPAKKVKPDLADITGSLNSVRQSIDQLRWIFRGSPYLQTLNAGLNEPEFVLSELTPAVNGIDLTQEDVLRVKEQFGQYIEMRVEVTREFSRNEGFTARFNHAYEVRDKRKNPPHDLAVVFSEEPAFSGRGTYTVLVKDLGKVDTATTNGGFKIDVPRYAVIPKQEVSVWRKYKKIQPQIREFSTKADGFYQAVLNRFDQLPQALQAGTAFPVFVVPGMAAQEVAPLAELAEPAAPAVPAGEPVSKADLPVAAPEAALSEGSTDMQASQKP